MPEFLSFEDIYERLLPVALMPQKPDKAESKAETKAEAKAAAEQTARIKKDFQPPAEEAASDIDNLAAHLDDLPALIEEIEDDIYNSEWANRAARDRALDKYYDDLLRVSETLLNQSTFPLMAASLTIAAIVLVKGGDPEWAHHILCEFEDITLTEIFNRDQAARKMTADRLTKRWEHATEENRLPEERELQAHKYVSELRTDVADAVFEAASFLPLNTDMPGVQEWRVPASRHLMSVAKESPEQYSRMLMQCAHNVRYPDVYPGAAQLTQGLYDDALLHYRHQIAGQAAQGNIDLAARMLDELIGADVAMMAVLPGNYDFEARAEAAFAHHVCLLNDIDRLYGQQLLRNYRDGNFKNHEGGDMPGLQSLIDKYLEKPEEKRPSRAASPRQRQLIGTTAIGCVLDENPALSRSNSPAPG